MKSYMLPSQLNCLFSRILSIKVIWWFIIQFSSLMITKCIHIQWKIIHTSWLQTGKCLTPVSLFSHTKLTHSDMTERLFQAALNSLTQGFKFYYNSFSTNQTAAHPIYIIWGQRHLRWVASVPGSLIWELAPGQFCVFQLLIACCNSTWL